MGMKITGWEERLLSKTSWYCAYRKRRFERLLKRIAYIIVPWNEHQPKKVVYRGERTEEWT